MAEVTRNDERSRYEIAVDGQRVGVALYRDRGNRRIVVHTELEEGHEGQGLGSTLVRGALDDTRAQGMRVVPVCPYVEKWIGRHPDYADLVDTAVMTALDS